MEQEQEIIKKAADVFSKDHNVAKLAEENAELTVAAFHFFKGKAPLSHIIDEMVDAEICRNVVLEIIKKDYPKRDIDIYMKQVRDKKLQRMKQRTISHTDTDSACLR